MSKLSFDYSRFDNIVDSDDEKDHHPNLDRGLNQRVIRITRDRKEDEIDTEKQKLESEGKTEEAEKLERKRPLHEGNMCKVAEERTIINSSSGTKDRLVKDSEEFPIDEYTGFKENNDKLLAAFIDADWDQSRAMLMEKGDELLGECSNGYFMLTALEEEMKGNSKRVDKIVHQGQIVSQIRQLAQAMKRPPRDLVHRFFERFDTNEGREAFDVGVQHFQKHIKQRAIQKKEEQKNEAAAAPIEAKLMSADSAVAKSALPLVECMYKMTPQMRKSMAPKGLDPVEVYENLPPGLKEAFKASSVDMLEKAANAMGAEEFEPHFQRCKDAGLWEEELNAFVHVQMS